ncbi:MAG: response regulator [Sedimentisphaerales bacterium]|nr:response regulator [Sedimentisphaerales bacterium]
MEDHPVNQIVAKRMIAMLGCQVELADNGRQAVDILQDQPFDLVFMDCQMPEMDGYEATARIRRFKSREANIPIIAMTAHAMPGDREKCLNAGMDDYISKPLLKNALIPVMQRWARLDASDAGRPDDPAAESPEPTPEPQAKTEMKTESTATDEYIIFDPRQALRALDGDIDVLRDIAELFLESTMEDLSALAQALGANETDSASRLAHKIKGAAANLGAESVRAAARELELAAKAQQQDRLAQLMQTVESEFQQLRTYLKSDPWDSWSQESSHAKGTGGG